MSLAVRPLVVSLRDEVRRGIIPALTAAEEIRAKRPAQASRLEVAVDALLSAVEQMLVCATEMERRHFAGMAACAAQPTTRKFNGEPMLGTPTVRRVATTRGNNSKSTVSRRRPGKARAAPASPRKRKRPAAGSAAAAALADA